jgi:hypothetical protein
VALHQQILQRLTPKICIELAMHDCIQDVLARKLAILFSKRVLDKIKETEKGKQIMV